MSSRLSVTETLHTVFVPASGFRIVTAVGLYTHHVVLAASPWGLGWSPALGATPVIECRQDLLLLVFSSVGYRG